VCGDEDAPSCTHYLAYVQSIVDQLDSVARLLDSLERSALLSETLVILYSDHGEEFFDHEAEQRAWRVDPRGIYGAGHGQSLFQELLHVPLWIWHPDVLGRPLEAPASLVDVAPTALEWLGVEDVDADWDGRSLARWVAGDQPPPGAPRPLYSTRIAYGPEQVAVVRGPWKRIVRTATERELFDLSRDPREREAVQRPEIERELDALLASYGAHEPVEAAEPPPLSEAQLEQLQSLGYLEDASQNAPPDARDAPQ
jgi:arylsulfatase A-like enzyme